MGFFGSKCCDNGNDSTMLWFIILFLLLFCGNRGEGNCGCNSNNSCSISNPCCD